MDILAISGPVGNLPFIRICPGRKSCISFSGRRPGSGQSAQGFGLSLRGLYWIPERLPGVEAPQQWPNVLVPFLIQQPRHPGAGGLIRSSTVHHDGPAAGNLLVAEVKLTGRDAERAPDLGPFYLEVEVRAEINNGDVFTAFEAFF